MRKTLAGIAAIGMMAGMSAPALSKAHMQPSDRADQLGQANANGLSPTGARNVDARALVPGDEKGVDGRTFSDVRSASGGSERGMKAGTMTKPSSGDPR
jgi:hypothetical protein